ncbi:hypothetical protein GTP55_09720 [Duganella sp. FT109W]|uniref:Uncharacterized protein n=1 Tax=Duganella margarita TaxID=2692170 RepID=A0ABW9WHI8_9BURK|nr:hypothetical protein [Duganella margarita]MYN39650.1 hypothetical protein [Duganella margarita]
MRRWLVCFLIALPSIGLGSTCYGTVAQGKTFVYGETGLAQGGPIRPHKTHQAGLSVDFMVPVLNAAGESVPLPGNVSNQFGYGIEFDQAGRFEDLRIDYVCTS